MMKCELVQLKVYLTIDKMSFSIIYRSILIETLSQRKKDPQHLRSFLGYSVLSLAFDM